MDRMHFELWPQFASMSFFTRGIKPHSVLGGLNRTHVISTHFLSIQQGQGVVVWPTHSIVQAEEVGQRHVDTDVVPWTETEIEH